MRVAERAAAVCAAALYAVDAAADLALVATGNEEARVVTKPALMPLLALVVGLAAPTSRAALPFSLGLLASAAGDAVLLDHGDAAFAAGAVAFVVAHAAYIVAFARLGRGPGLVRRLPAVAVPYVLAWLGTSAFLWPHLGQLAGVAVPYGAVVTAMALAALDLAGRVPVRFAVLAAGGGVAFLSSDTTLAIARFVPRAAAPHAELVVMATYLVAQSALATAVVGASPRRRSRTSGVRRAGDP